MPERREHRLRIVMGIDQSAVVDHAQRVLRAMDAVDVREPYKAIPRGIAMHAARFPLSCQECGETYWTTPGVYRYFHAECEGRKSRARPGFAAD